MKKIMVLALMFSLLVLSLCSCAKKEEEGLTSITLNEVAHSIFYAPQYVAIEKGYFKEEGLDVKLVNGSGADNVMTAVLSGEADIGFMGSEASIYVFNEGSGEKIINFAQLTQRAGNFLVARKADEDFTWKKLKGKTVLAGRKGGMPQMVFEYILKKNNMDPQKDLNMVQNIDFGLTAEAFASGQGDYSVEFEPFAASLEKEKKGVVVASLGVDSGMVPYTAYSAKESYIKKNADTIQKFTNALQKGMDFVKSHTPQEIAEVIQPQFKETERETLTTIIERYYDQGTWKDNLVFEKESFDLLQDILESGGELSSRVSYEELVNTEFASKAPKTK
ncbi:MAG: ABC transporter substrate-binding protein [Eubacterium sp.]|nr:ABC transporter substrate-binding protein [Eubacterium sp.]